MAARYVHGPGEGGEALVSVSRFGNKSFYHADERGSVIASTNGSGALAWINRYDEYGRPGQAAMYGRFQFTGQPVMTRDLQYHRARIYDPELGRFLQTDPIGFGDGPNRYVYVGGDPVNFRDPLGLQRDHELPPIRQDGNDPNHIIVIGRPCAGRLLCGSISDPFQLSDIHRDIATISNPSSSLDFASGGADVGGGEKPQNRNSVCRLPAVQAALNHPDYKNMLRDAWRMSQRRGNIEVGFNFGSYLFGGRGFGDIYPGTGPRSIIFRDDIDSLAFDGMWNPEVHFHLHPPGTNANTSDVDSTYARRTSAIVVAISPKGTDCTDGRR